MLLDTPEPRMAFHPGDVIAVSGRVIELTGAPIVDVFVNATLRTVAGSSIQSSGTMSDNGGQFFVAITLPAGLDAGTYLVTVDAADPGIQDAEVQILVRSPPSSPLPGLLAFVVVLTVATVVAVLAILRGRRKGPPVCP